MEEMADTGFLKRIGRTDGDGLKTPLSVCAHKHIRNNAFLEESTFRKTMRDAEREGASQPIPTHSVCTSSEKRAKGATHKVCPQ